MEELEELFKTKYSRTGTVFYCLAVVVGVKALIIGVDYLDYSSKGKVFEFVYHSACAVVLVWMGKIVSHLKQIANK